ncbi:unnamed protein product [Strongylus vulgaris]|uniref:Post-SET domain-containing protein n=1 Tax=Strongylus vulgaris TaxID=40348 RepID=A0A3P7KKI8_STRVU|nr:unnamed protein product [Strongylus vulgaris]
MMALDSQRIIDCKEKGNDARFLNHSCSPNCKVETVYVVVNRTKRPNGVTVKYDKRITIYTIEDVPAGTELCFNYQMTQYNIGCPLPDCKCGAPNCTGTLGATAHGKLEKAGQELEAVTVDSQKSKKKKQKRKAASSPALPEKKRYGSVHILHTQTPGSASRGCRVINGFKEPISEIVEDEKLKRALLNGEALEKLSDTKPSQKVVNGLRKNRRIAAELSSVNVIVS